MSISSAAAFKFSTFSGNNLTTFKEIRTKTFVCVKEVSNTLSRSKLTSPTSIYTHRLTFTNHVVTVHFARPDSTGNTSSSLEGVKSNFDDEYRVLKIGNSDQLKNDFGGGGGGGNECGGSFGGRDGGEGGSETHRFRGVV